MSDKKVGEVAKELRVSVGTVRNWIDRGYIQAIRLPSGHRRISEDELERLLGQLFGMPSAEEAEPSDEERQPLRTRALTDDEWGPAI